MNFLANHATRCWDGVNLDSPDHKSHVAYPVGGTFETGAPCPSTHPVKIPQLFFEIMWDTRQFNDQSKWPTDGSQPFVFSMGDQYVYNLSLAMATLSDMATAPVTVSTVTTCSAGRATPCSAP